MDFDSFSNFFARIFWADAFKLRGVERDVFIALGYEPKRRTRSAKIGTAKNESSRKNDLIHAKCDEKRDVDATITYRDGEFARALVMAADLMFDNKNDIKTVGLKKED